MSADRALVEWGHALDAYPIVTLRTMVDEEAAQAARSVGRIAGRIADLQAVSLEGVFVQVRALETIYFGDEIDFDMDAPATDMRLAIQILRTLRTMRGQDGR